MYVSRRFSRSLWNLYVAQLGQVSFLQHVPSLIELKLSLMDSAYKVDIQTFTHNVCSDWVVGKRTQETWKFVSTTHSKLLPELDLYNSLTSSKSWKWAEANRLLKFNSILPTSRLLHATSFSGTPVNGCKWSATPQTARPNDKYLLLLHQHLITCWHFCIVRVS